MDNAAAFCLEEGEMTDLGLRVGIALLPLDGLAVAKSEARVKTDTLPAAESAKSRCCEGASAEGGVGQVDSAGIGVEGGSGNNLAFGFGCRRYLPDVQETVCGSCRDEARPIHPL